MVFSVIRHRTRGLVAKRALALTFLKIYMQGQDPPTPSLGPLRIDYCDERLVY